MKKILFCAAIALSIGAMAQDYKHSAGFRLGGTSAITYKNFVETNESVEFFLSGREDGLQLTAIYSFHRPMELEFNENFFLHYGIGTHIGYEDRSDLDKVLVRLEPPQFNFERRTYFVMGVDAMAGVEYRWYSVPMTISFDIKPYFTFIGMRYTDARFWDAAISFKYIF